MWVYTCKLYLQASECINVQKVQGFSFALKKNFFLHADMLSFSIDLDKASITRDETATITCSGSLNFPPLTSITIFKDGVKLSTTSEEMLQIQTNNVANNVFGSYVCTLDALGLPVHKEVILKEEGTNSSH